MFAISWFKDTEKKHGVFRGKDCIEKYCQSLRKHTVKIINFEKNKTKLSASYKNARFCYICKETFEDTHAKDKKIATLGTIVSLFRWI